MLGTAVGVGNDPVGGGGRAGSVQHVNEVSRTVEVLEPFAGIGILGGDEVRNGRRIDRVQLAEEPSQPL